MSTKSLADHLTQALSRLKPNNAPVRTAVVGVGSELHGDDAAGILAARLLLPLLAGHDHLLVIDAGPAPENCTGTLRRFQPDLVLLIDAAQMNDPAGAVGWLPWQSIDGISASTHTLPLHLVAQYPPDGTGLRGRADRHPAGTEYAARARLRRGAARRG